jgi:cyclic pyranopterin phosphate synthase
MEPRVTIDLTEPRFHGRRAADLVDRRGRMFRDLRISLTDRCNFRCTYCMPRDEFGSGHDFLSRSKMLTDREIIRLAERFIDRGAQKIRLTGGEPLLRSGIVGLVTELSAFGVDLAMTSNGSLLPRLAGPLARAGLRRVTISLDSLDDALFRRMSDTRYGVADVLAGIHAAENAGLGPVKINTVVQRGVNDGAGLSRLLEIAEFFRGTPHIVRFIEFMDVGTTNGWDSALVVPSAQIVAAIDAVHRLEPMNPVQPGEVARRYRYADGGGEIGFISSVSKPFCGSCSRARLSADGQLFTCLFAGRGTDLRGPLRDGASDDDLDEMISKAWRRRDDRYSELRSSGNLPEARNKIEMSFIGG